MNILDIYKDKAKDGYKLEDYKKERNKIVNLILNDPKKFANTLYTKKSEGWIWKTSELFSPYFDLDDAKYCCLLEKVKVSDYNSDKPATCFLSKISKTPDGYKVEFNKELFFIKIFNMINLDIQYKNITINNSNLCNNIKLNNIYTLLSDKFTNSILIGYVLDVLSTQFKFENKIIKTYSATVCQDKNVGVLILEYLNGNSFNTYIKNNTIDANFIKTILKQVINTLDTLYKYSYFTHNHLTTNSLAIFKENNNINVKVGDFENSSLFLNIPKDNSKLYIQANNLRHYNYQLDKDSYKIISYSNDNNLMFNKSLDIYTLFISILNNKQLFEIIFKDDTLKKIFFEILWYPEDISIIYKIIVKNNSSNKLLSYNEIVDILKNIRLKCNLSELILKYL